MGIQWRSAVRLQNGSSWLRGRVRGDRIVELPVVQHLSPDVVIDDSPDVLQKLSIDVLGDRGAEVLDASMVAATG